MVTEGDNNTRFFHLLANGRRKNLILSLETDHGEITSQDEIRGHIYDFYKKKLFGSDSKEGLSLDESFWDNQDRFSEETKAILIQPFSKK